MRISGIDDGWKESVVLFTLLLPETFIQINF